ncbi:MAG: hypothetical protein JXP34_28530 [Planctomycetes bacterium]|nr:hypothetical protein [Planctomycetota bacterium]
MDYRPTGTDPHWREEEVQWARILAMGDPARGMALVLLQKACTAFHEFEPALDAGALVEEKAAFFRERLAGRVRLLLTALEANGLDGLAGVDDLRRLLEAIEAAESARALADLTDRMHGLGHTLCEALERTA